MRPLRHLIARLRGIIAPEPDEALRGGKRPLDSIDGITAAGVGDIQRGGEAGGGAPPAGWVKSYDEGRPRT